MRLSPSQQYQADLADPSFHSDPCQAEAMTKLDDIYRKLCLQQQKKQRWLLGSGKNKAVKGLYMWGGVGTGKSYLMNTFFNCLPFENKLRLHFHEFMRQVHHELTEIQGTKNPLQVLAKRWAKKTAVLCFDEFFVKDIADAMILGNLFSALFERGLCLVTTSNRIPSELYKNGLQRDRFLPAIEIIKQHVDVLHVDNNIDYRLEKIKPADVYFTPLTEQATQQLMQAFHYYAGNDVTPEHMLMINKRDIIATRCSDTVAWFEFSTLCEQPLGSEDYLALAEKFAVIIIANIPKFNHYKNDAAVRFINLIDVLYDKHTLLIVSAASPSKTLYQGDKWAFEFQRTESRLMEMQSEAYIDDCDNS